MHAGRVRRRRGDSRRRGRPIAVCYEVTPEGERASGGACDTSTSYTNAFGRNGQTQPFPGSIRQWLATMDNNVGVDAGGPVISSNRNYAGPGVRAPN